MILENLLIFFKNLLKFSKIFIKILKDEINYIIPKAVA